MEKLLISACLTGENCKYNGGSNFIGAARLEALRASYELVPVCPESDGGLPTPRIPSERLGDKVINAQGTDVTAEYIRGAARACALAAEQGIALALLKEKSPSCGCGEIYDGSFTHTVTAGDGVTAEALKKLGLAIYGETQTDILLRRNKMYAIKTPIRIKNLEINNRLVMPPMATEKSGEDGAVSEALCKYYEKKSKGGHIGLIIMEHSCVAPEGRASKAQVCIWDDSFTDGFRRLADIVHRDGCKIFAQINHAGGAANSGISGHTSIGASARPLPRNRGAAEKVMDAADIARVTEAFAQAAGRVKAAGFDGVEIHSAHGYLLDQFYSPVINDRTDSYTGATLEGRIRFHLEVIAAVRKVVGEDFPVALRLGACDYMDGGTTIADSVAAAVEFEKAGIDLLDISGGMNGYVNPNSKEQGYFSEISEAVKAAVSIPVILTGGVTEIDAAEKLLKENKADMIGVGRTILYNSHWAEEAMNSLV